MDNNKTKRRLSDFRPQEQNANRHTEYGFYLLERSLYDNGWLGAMTAAADGEIIAGSARLEKAAEVYGADVEPIVIETDGSRPVIIKRTDIPDAKHPRAIRAAIADNRVAEVDLEWDTEMLAEILEDMPGVLDGLFTEKDFREKGIEVPDFAPVNEDDVPRLDEPKLCKCPNCGHEFKAG